MKSINDESISLIIQSWKVIMESITLIAQNFSQAYIRTQHSIKLAGANFGMHKSFRFRSPQRSRSPASPRHIVIAVGLGLAINRWEGLFQSSSNKCFKIVMALRIERTPICTHSPQQALPLPLRRAPNRAVVAQYRKPRSRVWIVPVSSLLSGVPASGTSRWYWHHSTQNALQDGCMLS